MLFLDVAAVTEISQTKVNMNHALSKLVINPQITVSFDAHTGREWPHVS